jgi:hypothetical protein
MIVAALSIAVERDHREHRHADRRQADDDDRAAVDRHDGRAAAPPGDARVLHTASRTISASRRLELPMIDAHFGFDPNAVVPLGDGGNAYPALDVTAPWGHISVDKGARIPNDWSKIVVAAEDRGKLELKPPCKIAAGARAGDYRVTCE